VATFCQANGQLLLPFMELIEQVWPAAHTLTGDAGRRAIEPILGLGAEQIAGLKATGRGQGGGGPACSHDG